MIVKIITGPNNYDVSTLYRHDESEFIIGVDQGCSFLKQANIPIDLAIGDFDSVQDDVDTILSYAKKTLLLQTKKDFTDTHVAINEALRLNPKEIIIYGGIGGRFDHSYANVMLLKKGNITMINESSKMFVLSKGTHLIDHDYQYISFFAIEEVSNLSLTGFAYELTLDTLSTDDPLCISNEGSGEVSFQQGKLLVIQSNE